MNGFGVTHAGIVVADLEAAVETLSAALGLEWAPQQHRQISIWYRGRQVETDIGFTYSVQGPPHLELLTAKPGTPWEEPGMHHVGFWSEDLSRDVDASEAAGLELEVTYAVDPPHPVGFAYLTTPDGLRVEYVDAARKLDFEAWLAGGSFPAVEGN